MSIQAAKNRLVQAADLLDQATSALRAAQAEISDDDNATLENFQGAQIATSAVIQASMMVDSVYAKIVKAMKVPA